MQVLISNNPIHDQATYSDMRQEIRLLKTGKGRLTETTKPELTEH